MTSYVLPIDKPIGPTSHDMVALARRSLGTRRIGHTGTLDPFASGLLLLCVGHATRLAEYLSDLPKSYRAVARLDGATPTDDDTSERVTFSDHWRMLAADRIVAAFESQRGEIMQTPSSFSAKKIAGERAYEIARRGDPVDLAAAAITIYDIRVTDVELPRIGFEVTCSTGTYVRAIARDVGRILGTGGYLTELRRTSIGAFRVEDALAPEAMDDRELRAQRALPLKAVVAHLPQLEVTEAEERAVRFGQRIEHGAAIGTVALTRNGELIAIATADGACILPRKVFPRD